jgi:hypothetical protein
MTRDLEEALSPFVVAAGLVFLLALLLGDCRCAVSINSTDAGTTLAGEVES